MLRRSTSYSGKSRRWGSGGIENHATPILVAGARRLEACKQLGWTEIDTNVVELYDIDLELAEIDENLIREELTALDRAEQLERRKWIFGQKGGHKMPTPGGEQEIGFAKDVADKIGMSKRSINRHLAIDAESASLAKPISCSPKLGHCVPLSIPF